MTNGIIPQTHVVEAEIPESDLVLPCRPTGLGKSNVERYSRKLNQR